MARYVKVSIRPDNIITYEYLSPVENADTDLEVMKFITSEILKIIKEKKLKKVRILGDISKYKRNDCISIIGFDFPALKSRKYVIETFNKMGYVKAAYFKDGGSKAVTKLLAFVSEFSPTKMRLFSSKGRALKWLKES